MKKVRLSFIAICLLSCILCGCGNNSTRNKKLLFSEKINVPLTNVSDFSKGKALVKYSENDKDGNERKFVSIIDTKGNIIMKDDITSSNKCYEQFVDGIGYYRIDKDYYLFDSKGKEIASSTNGDFDEILTLGNGMALVYKYKDDIVNPEKQYGVLNSNGEFVMDFVSLNCYQIENKVYLGDGIFGICTYQKYLNSASQSDWIIINSKTKKIFYIYNIDSIPYYTNGIANIFCLDDSSYFWPSIHYPRIGFEEGEDNAVEIEQSFKLNSDGSYETYDFNFLYSTADKMICKTDDNHIKIISATDLSSFNFNDYDSKYISEVDYTKGYGLIKINGADGNKYFTVLDKNGKMKFEAQKYKDLSYSQSNIVYSLDNKYFVLDLNGKVVAENLPYSRIGGYYDGLAFAKYNDTYCYIDKNGKVIIGQ